VKAGAPLRREHLHLVGFLRALVKRAIFTAASKAAEAVRFLAGDEAV
jgi:hypothetical protein